MKVSAQIKIYEVRGKEVVGLDCPELTLRSHWSRSDIMVVLEFEDKCITVLTSDLIKAISSTAR